MPRTEERKIILHRVVPHPERAAPPSPLRQPSSRSVSAAATREHAPSLRCGHRARQIESRSRYAFPHPEIHAAAVVAHHPRRYMLSLLQGFPFNGGDVFSQRTGWSRRRKNFTPEFGKHDTQVARRGITFLEKIGPMPPHTVQSLRSARTNAMKSVPLKVRCTKCPSGRSSSGEACSEFVRRPVHQLHHAPATPHDGPTVAPRDSRRQKTGYLPVLAPRKEMGYGHGSFSMKSAVSYRSVKRIEQLASKTSFSIRHRPFFRRRYSKSPTPTTVRKRPPE